MNPSPLELKHMLAEAADAGDFQARTFLHMFQSFTARLRPYPAAPATTHISGGDKRVQLAASKSPAEARQERCDAKRTRAQRRRAHFR